MQIKNDIQIDSLKQYLMDFDLINREKQIGKQKQEPMLKTLTEHSFFTENEIRISEKIRDTLFGALHCNPVIARHKANSSIVLQKQYIVLTYPKRGINMMEVLSVLDKNNRFYYEFLLNIHNTFLDLLAVSERNFVFIDFSYVNMYFTKHTHVSYLCHFEKCLSFNDVDDDSEKNVLIFKKTLEQMTYFGNKHVILFILHKMRENKDLDLTDSNMSILIREYVDQLYFIRFFSPEVKEEYRMKCEAYVKNHVMDVLNTDDYFGSLLSFKHKHFFREMENFKLNSFFLNMLILIVPQKKILINGFFDNLCYPFDTITHVSLLLIDSVKEFDHMDENILDTFYLNVNKKKNLF